MQKDNRGTMASLTPQIGLPRPSSTWDLQWGARTTARHTDGGERGAPLQIPSAGWSCQADLGRQGGYCASIIPLHPLIVPLLCPYS